MPVSTAPHEHRPVVLLVEGEPERRDQLEQSTREAGFEVQAVGDALQALQRVDRRPPDLVVTALRMARLDGQQLVSRLRQMSALEATPILMILPDGSRYTRITLLESGADDFIVEPVEPEEYQVRLRALARRAGLLASEVRVERSADAQALEARNRELDQLTLALLAALERADALDEADTGNHILRVAAYAELLARAYGCAPPLVEQISRYAGLHDVGKLGVRDAILTKPGKLTPEEFEEMKAHTLFGADLLRDAGLPAVARNIALHHHERWDGHGYPRGLAGRDIPIEARIVSVVDVFDALRSRRCYKPAFSYDKSKRIMLESAGAHLDPELVALFFRQSREIAHVAARYADDPDPLGGLG